MTAIYTTLNDTLQRHADGWRWADSSLEPRVTDLLLCDLAPNFRCCRRGQVVYVEIPCSWRNARYWPGGRVDADAEAAIAELIREAGKRAPIYADGLAEAVDDHRLTVDGYLVDSAQWDHCMREHAGVWWPKQDEGDILAKARALGWA